MIYVGIDVARLNHFASAISSDGEELIEPSKFTNDADVFQLLSSHLDSLPDDSFLIGLETTAHYGDNLVRYLVYKGHKFCVINPLQTTALWKNNIRKTISDKVVASMHLTHLTHLLEVNFESASDIIFLFLHILLISLKTLTIMLFSPPFNLC